MSQDQPFHPAANIFPMLEGKEFDSLKEDIQKNGQQLEIWYYEGLILDGRNRWRACKELGIEPWESELDPEKCPDTVALVVSMNLLRRHLDTSQRAMAAAKAKGLYVEKAKERQKEAAVVGGKTAGRGRKKKDSLPENLPEGNGDARDAVGQVFHVSGKTVDHATTVLEHGSQALISSVERGTIPASKAAKIAKTTPKSEQMKVATTKSERKTKTPYEQLQHWWEKSDADTKKRFREWIE